ncbi:MAG: Porphobilinogen deaminase [Chlamydiae bacterium]|nr:Porphobilinogen deaminase [Chlamydiota bacterium]
MKIKVGSRTSPLSRVQVAEVDREVQQFSHEVLFEPIFGKTTGDKDRATSFLTLDTTAFLTREVDALILEGKCRIGIHSAKDLPLSLPEGLVCVTLTRGEDPADVLVMAKGITIESLQEGAKVATSSLRREESVRKLCPQCSFVDIRGTIGERLQWIKEGKVEGLVVAEAALIRLGMTHLNRIRLPGETAPLQGRLAIVAREEDEEISSLFSPLVDEA